MNIATFAKAFLFASLVFNISCSSNSDSPKEGSGQAEKAGQITDTRVCNETPTTPPTVFGSWRSEEATGNGIRFSTLMTIQGNSVQFQMTCRKGAAQATVNLQVPASVTAQTIEFLGSDEEEAKGQADGETVTCWGNLAAGTKISYQFQGPCLSAQIGNETVLMVPAF